ncbi:MAG: MMPL family transporter, partial [Bacteroidales bacterium]|nr:MMPL family transporter [Bacteroidales bacterium]
RIDAWNQYWTPEKVDYAWREISRSARKVGLDPEMFAPFRAMVTAPYYAESLYDSGILPEGLLCNFIEESEGRFLVFNSVKMDSSEKGAVDKAVASLPHAVVIDPLFYTSDMIQIVHEDFNLTLSISSIFVLIVLLLSFLNLWSALLAFLPMFLSWYVVQGLMAIFGLQFNLINIVVSTFVFGIGVDYSIFVMRGLLAEARGEGSDLLDYHKAAIVFSAFVLVVVVVSLLFAVHPAISSIGVCTIIGMASTILITYTLQPFVFRMLLKVPFIRKSFKVKSDAE